MVDSTNDKPTALPVKPEGIPDELKRWPQWIVWRYEWIEDKWTKPPRMARGGRLARSNDPTTWDTFENAIAAYETEEWDGIGFCPRGEDPFVFGDHDDVIHNGSPDPDIVELVRQGNTYAELSPSAVGVRQITKGELPSKGRKNGRHEVYDRDHYLTITGHKLRAAALDIHENQRLVDRLYELAAPEPKKASTNGARPQPRKYRPGERGGRIRELFGKLNSEGLNLETIITAVLEENERSFDPPKTEEEIRDEVSLLWDQYESQNGQGPASREGEIRSGGPRPEPHLQSIGNLEHELMAEPRWAIEGIVADGLALLAAKAKIGKSWLALDWAIAIAEGGKAMKVVEAEQGDVVYLALEDNKRRLQDRMRKALRGRPWPKRLHYATEWPKIDAGGIQHLDEWLASHPETRLVIIDVWTRVRQGRKRNADIYAEDYEHLRELKALADTHGTCVLVIHHTRKAGAEDVLDEISGTGGVAAAADTILVLHRSRGEADAELWVNGRDVEERKLALRFQLGQWSLMGDASQVMRSRERREILDLMTKTNQRYPEGLTVALIAELLEKPRQRINALVHKMFVDGELRRLPNSKYLPPLIIDSVDSVESVDPLIWGGSQEADDDQRSTLSDKKRPPCPTCGSKAVVEDSDGSLRCHGCNRSRGSRDG